MNKKTIIALSFVAGVLLFWLTSGILLFAKVKVQENIDRQKEVCIELTDATIIQMKKTTRKSNDKYVNRWIPVYEYYVDGVCYEKESTSDYKKGFFEEGDQVDIYYNPDNPEEVYVPAENSEKSVMILTILMVVFFVGGFLILGIMFPVLKNNK